MNNHNKISKHKIDNENKFINTKVKWKPTSNKISRLSNYLPKLFTNDDKNN